MNKAYLYRSTWMNHNLTMLKKKSKLQSVDRAWQYLYALNKQNELIPYGMYVHEYIKGVREEYTSTHDSKYIGRGIAGGKGEYVSIILVELFF